MEQKDNTGAIFKNDFKEEGDNKPDYKGKMIVDGAEKEIALWLSESNKGIKYFSAKIQEPYVKPEATEEEVEETEEPQPIEGEDEEDLPF